MTAPDVAPAASGGGATSGGGASSGGEASVRPGTAVVSVVPVVTAVVAALVAVVAGLDLTGAVAPTLLFDPGPLVRWGLPVAQLAADLGAAVTVGVLVLAAVVLPVERAPGTADDERHPRMRAYGPALDLVAAAAAVWTLAEVAGAVLAYSQTSGTLVDDPAFGGQLGAWLTGSDPGRGYLVTAGVAAVITLVAAGARSIGVTGVLVMAALVGLVPPALAGHAAGSSDHETAVTSLGLHLLGACVWVGGLVGLVLLRRGLGDRLAVSVARYSTLAGVAFVLVATSGVINAWIRIQHLSALGTRYGLLVGLKVAALAVLGVAGALHRRRAVPDLAAGVHGTFARLAAVEVVVMGVAVGLAAALAAGAPPAPGRRTLPTLAESLTGYPLPPPPTAARWLTQWQPDLLWIVVCVLSAGLYAGGVRRLRRRGDRWPVLRAVSWLVGVLLLGYVTSGPPAVYGRVLFSAHMIGHMTLSMVVPVFLVLGAPVTLALRALPPRTDGSRGAREWLLAGVESRYARLLSFPPVAAFLFAGSLVFFYFSPLFGLALRTHVGHELMHVHFLFAGYLFAWVLVGVDPGPHRVSSPLRLVTLLAAMAFHAFFGVALLATSTVLQADWFGRLGRTWGPTLLADQRAGGGVAWGIGDVPAIVLAVIIAVQWSVSDDREARRRDRAADRDGDAELTAYNEMLARMAAEDRSHQPSSDGGQATTR